MAERLGRIPELLARPGNLLREHAEMVAEGEHVFEDGRCSAQVFFIVSSGLLRGCQSVSTIAERCLKMEWLK